MRRWIIAALLILAGGCDQVPQSHLTVAGRSCTSLGPPWAQVWVNPNDRTRAC